MKNKEPLWGEQHNGILVNYEENSILFKKIFNTLLEILHNNKIHNFELDGRIKDAGMLAGKISRCQTEQDILTTKYEELGFRIIFSNSDSNVYSSFEQLFLIKANLEKDADFIKNYIDNPRKDGLILGDNPNLSYQAFHIYTQRFENKKIEIQLMTEDMLKTCNYLTSKYGAYWKQKDFKEKRIATGDER